MNKYEINNFYDLYRVTEVRTPSDKRIYYEYDGLGRQSSRSTPDAGMVRYKYDRNDNLRFSQDRNQYNKPTETPPGKYITFRGYDGLNRLLYIGDTYTENYLMQWESLNPNPGQNYGFENYSLSPENFLVINVYDTLVNYPANANIFTSSPQDYYSEKNNTKGSLCATAYRTLGTDGWNFKYYRYDARGRVKKMWNYINGFGWKTMDYKYNSQNQVTEMEYQTTNDNDYKVFYYEYDKAGRLKTSATNETRPPLPFAEYRYNQNSQIDSVFYNNSSYYITNYYNTRNWIIQSNSSSNNQFNYVLEYYANGNISNQNINGDYKGNFSDTKEIRVSYTYDNSNRLTDAEPFSRQYFDLRGTYGYDADGNFLNLSRSYNGDEFAYEYYPGTNRLRKVTGESDQFTYDYNGNLKNDYFNNNTDIKYDHRNLITEITRVDDLIDPPATYTTTYKYDEAGNRINKKITKDDGSTIEIIVNEYYIRDISGKEIAVYEDTDLEFWNVWGLGNEGKISSDKIRYYYIKDHLGSIRAVLNDNNDLVEAVDYDPWGHIARYWSSTSSKYKFTGKERDNETGYDYFGARFYDSRVGRWGQEDLLINQYPAFSPYCYSLNNPILLKDPDGRWIPEYDENTNKITVRPEEGDDLQSLVSQIGISAEKFVQDQMKLGINNFEINIGETVFEITQYVTPNAKYNSALENSNCFGFCIIAMTESTSEAQSDEQTLKSNLFPMSETSEPKSGNLAFFTMAADVIEMDNTISYKKGDVGHAAIFIIKDKKGESYFINRKSYNQKVTMDTKKKLNEYFKEFREENKKYYKQLPFLNNEPVFYKK